MKKSSQKKGKLIPTDDSVFFLPLGGVGEIGMNASLYGYDGKWILVDLGASFANPLLPGANAILPDMSFIIERRKDLLGLIVTHAHEDHIGAIPWLWKELGCPIYATFFAACVLKKKWQLDGHGPMPKIHIIEYREKFQLGSFDLQFLMMTHSIPEPSALVLRCGNFTLFHSGDWKLDYSPVIGDSFDKKSLVALGKEKIDALICDSTNVFDLGHSGSEGDLQENFEKLINRYTQCVAVTMFASNVSRLYTISKAAIACGRTPILVGSALKRMYESARESGYMQDLPEFPENDSVKHIAPDKILMICTGSQAEPRSALYRMAYQSHPHFQLNPGDVVLFSSRIIPGNEKPIEQLKTQLLQRDILCLDGKENGIHVSGHPAQQELKQLYEWLKPNIVIPIHGEWAHLQCHSEWARSCNIPQSLTVQNGNLVAIRKTHAHIITHINTEQVFVDGCRLVKENDLVFTERRKMAWNGAVAVTLFADQQGKMIQDPIFATFGIDAEELLYDQACNLIDANVKSAKLNQYDDVDLREQKMMDIASKIVRKLCHQHFEKRPVTHVNLVRF